jgi:hypothetical protein
VLATQINGTYHEDTLADTYDANAATYNLMVTSTDVDVGVDFPRNQGLAIRILQDAGLPKGRETFDDDETMAWTGEAHRALRPPLLAGMIRICYTDAELYRVLMEEHPELCDDTVLDRYGELLSWFSEQDRTVEEAYADASGSWTREEFDEALSALADAGRLRRHEGPPPTIAWTSPTAHRQLSKSMEE